MLLPWIVTSVTWPRLTSVTKSENASVDCGPRVEDVWNRLKRATRSRPMTIQRARFLPKLFTLEAFPYRPGGAPDRTEPAHQTPARDKMLPRLNNCKAYSGKRVCRAKRDGRQGADAVAAPAEMRHRGDPGIIPQRRQHRVDKARQIARLRLDRGSAAMLSEIAEGDAA